MTIDTIGVLQPHIESGTLRALGVAYPERSPVLQGVPTISDDLAGSDGSPVNYVSVRSGSLKKSLPA